jgi:PKD repeat protein
MDNSSGIPNEWKWTFEGGDPETSTEKNPEGILYANEGSFSVTLEAINGIGSDTIVKEAYITTSTTILPEVEFESSTDFVCLGQQVNFFDMSIYAPNSWEWSFEPSTVEFLDGTDANSQNPMVIFTEAGTYSVTLTAWNLNGSSQLTKEEMIVAGGYTPYYVENFETDNLKGNHWTVENPDGDVTWQLFETGGTGGGTTSVGINFKEYFSIGERDRLISPQFNLTDLSSASLEFEHAYAQFVEGFSDSLIVYVSANCSEEWTRVYTGGEDGNGSFATHEITEDFWPTVITDWCMAGWGASCISIDLSPWVGQSGVRIAFESYANFGNPLMLDNVRLSQFVGVDETAIDDETIEVYPNPANSTFTVTLPSEQNFSELKLVNYMGQAVYTTSIDASSKTIEISPKADWAAGVYFLELSGNGTTSTKKVVLY